MPTSFYGKKKDGSSKLVTYGALGLTLLVIALAIFLPQTAPAPNTNPFYNYTDGGTKVAFVEFSDFECPYCARAQETVGQLKIEYAGRVNFVFKNFPVHGGTAELAGQAVECAAEQGLFEPYHLKLFQNQQAFTTASLKQLAQGIGIDEAKFAECIDSGKMASVVSASTSEGTALGVQATPTFFINGRKIEGAVDISQFRAAIDAELKKA
jgi:protein-disulfide isomerase